MQSWCQTWKIPAQFITIPSIFKYCLPSAPFPGEWYITSNLPSVLLQIYSFFLTSIQVESVNAGHKQCQIHTPPYQLSAANTLAILTSELWTQDCYSQTFISFALCVNWANYFTILFSAGGGDLSGWFVVLVVCELAHIINDQCEVVRGLGQKLVQGLLSQIV